MAGRDDFALAGDFFQRHGFRAVAASGHHHAGYVFVDQIGARAAQPGGEQAVGGRGRAAALDVAENRDAGFEVREFLKLPGEAHGVAGVPGFERGEFNLGLFFVVQSAGALALAFGGLERAVVVYAHRALGHGDDAEIRPAPAAAFDGLGDAGDIVGNFRNQNHVRAAGNS